jgi:PAS domain S-box-containing protein
MTEARRHTREEQIQAALEGAPVPIYVKDRERRYLLANRAARETVGLELGEIVGRTDAELLPSDSERFAEADRLVLENEEAFEREDRLRIGGSQHTFLTFKFPYLDQEGNVTGVAGISIDVTAKHEAKRLQHELAAAQERAIDELRSSQQEAVERLARAIEPQGAEGGWHVDRVARITAYLASQLGLDDEQILLLRAAALMHDVGNVAVSKEVLGKRGPLAPEERAEVERHAEAGHEILAGSECELLQMAARIALTHHEWFDGSGYPRGLAGEEIPVEGRIVAVADAFDSMLSERPYRGAMNVTDAVEAIREERGSHFDPEVADCLLEHLEDVLALRE